MFSLKVQPFSHGQILERLFERQASSSDWDDKTMAGSDSPGCGRFQSNHSRLHKKSIWAKEHSRMAPCQWLFGLFDQKREGGGVWQCGQFFFHRTLRFGPIRRSARPRRRHQSGQTSSLHDQVGWTFFPRSSSFQGQLELHWVQRPPGLWSQKTRETLRGLGSARRNPEKRISFGVCSSQKVFIYLKNLFLPEIFATKFNFF